MNGEILNEKGLIEVFANFVGGAISAMRYGEGHINDTYVVVTSFKRYIMQRINNRLFTNIPMLMNNIMSVTNFMRQKLRGDSREVLTLVPTKSGKAFYECETGYYRVYDFIEGATSYQTVTKNEHFFESAVAFGKFAEMLKEFDASGLHEVIPFFHNTEKRLENFKAAVKEDKFSRLKQVNREVDFFLDRARYASIVLSAIETGDVKVRVTHNDTKLNNVMIDDKTGKGICVIDLDTIMPGSILYDFGDSIRFGCNSGLEDEPNLSKVNFRHDLFNTYSSGYLSSFKGIEKTEKELLGFSGILMTYECGMRFLTDYLLGDTYFRVHREGHNLDRTRTQIKLVSDMEKVFKF